MINRLLDPSLLLCWGTLLLLTGCEIRDVPVADSAGRDASADIRGGREIQFVHGYQEGSAQAQKEGKPMLVFFTAQWCHFCHEMERDAFQSPEVVMLSRQFVCVTVDADQEPQVCREFRVSGYPTVQFVSPLGVPMRRIVGKRPGQTVLSEMQYTLQSVAHLRPSVPKELIR